MILKVICLLAPSYSKNDNSSYSCLSDLSHLQYIAELKVASRLPPIDGQFMLSPTKYRFENSENLTSGLDSIPIPFFG